MTSSKLELPNGIWVVASKLHEHSKLLVNPTSSDQFHIVRISDDPKRAANARRDYKKLQEQMVSEENDVKWDNSHKNNIQNGNWIGFIVGPVGYEIVECYKVKNVLSIDQREINWSNNQYTDQITNPVNNRNVIILEKQPPYKMLWKTWKQNCNYKPKYTPRGTISSKNPILN